MQGIYWVVVGDIHGHVGNFAKIPELPGCAGVIVSGDLTNLGGEAEAREVLDALEDRPVLAQIGNMDKGDVGDWLSRRGINLHCQARELAPGLVAFGVGGSTMTPFATPSEFGEDMYAQWLEELGQKTKNYPHRALISHNPPKDTACDDIGGGVHVGSVAVRQFIEREQPEVCICGHIHEGRATDHIGATLIVNPGQLSEGGYALLRLAGDRLTAELRRVD